MFWTKKDSHFQNTVLKPSLLNTLKTQLSQWEMIKPRACIRNLPFPFFCSSKIYSQNDAKRTSQPPVLNI